MVFALLIALWATVTTLNHDDHSTHKWTFLPLSVVEPSTTATGRKRGSAPAHQAQQSTRVDRRESLPTRPTTAKRRETNEVRAVQEQRRVTTRVSGVSGAKRRAHSNASRPSSTRLNTRSRAATNKNTTSNRPPPPLLRHACNADHLELLRPVFRRMRDHQRDLMLAWHLFQELAKTHKATVAPSAGSLIGLLRRGGAQPWDDDIDVWMSPVDHGKIARTLQANNWTISVEELAAGLPAHLKPYVRKGDVRLEVRWYISPSWFKFILWRHKDKLLEEDGGIAHTPDDSPCCGYENYVEVASIDVEHCRAKCSGSVRMRSQCIPLKVCLNMRNWPKRDFYGLPTPTLPNHWRYLVSKYGQAVRRSDLVYNHDLKQPACRLTPAQADMLCNNASCFDWRSIIHHK